ncbi:calmodulin calcium-dependent NAD kinase-like isoform X2 [Coffea arabica]|uniref:Calmodulin calcium-dependent NAD kinase-like isoform X2 n=1 Tax=Coffea arabica TaxID=13443 RepID=A0ABM4X1X5_COFAR
MLQVYLPKAQGRIRIDKLKKYKSAIIIKIWKYIKKSKSFSSIFNCSFILDSSIMHHQDGYGKVVLAHFLAATAIGLISAATLYFRRRKSKSSSSEDHHLNKFLAPFLDKTESGRVGKLEKFSDYVARQIGFKDGSECPRLSKLAYQYLKRSNGCHDRIYEYFANEADADSLYVKLVEEFERCILSYFAFYWSHASFMITQVLSVDSEQKKLKDFVMAATRSFWSGAAANAVVVEADAFKETDVIYKALSSRGHHDMLQTAELVHQSSTDAASSLLVTALNEGRDVIMDGTLSWEPFVEQTIAMVRNVHKHRYRMGVGYKVADDGTVTENYWEQIEEQGEVAQIRKPYRIELVGVVCDAYLAVVRGIRRAVQTGRAVRVKPQLKSHKRFANAFPRYCPLVDNARLYCTNDTSGHPKLIAWKDGDSKLLIDPEDINCLKVVGSLNDEAESIYELHKESDPILKPGSIWNDVVLLPRRKTINQELRTVIAKIEVPAI